MGYASGRDHACALAQRIVTVHSEQSRWFGPGVDGANLDADFGWLALGVRATAEQVFPSLSLELQEVLRAYAAGWSKWVTEEPLPPPCAGEPWVRAIDHLDLLTHVFALSLDGSGALFADLIGAAEPPSAQRPPPPLSRLDVFRGSGRGSNGWAIGAERSSTGGGMLLSNTHFPAFGIKQWHESHLTIPGQLDVYGVSLLGVPAINMGFTEHLAWTHTVSFAPRFTMYSLSLHPDDPTRYAFDGGWRDMQATDHQIEVLAADGSIGAARRTLYRSHYGPIWDAPVVGWNQVSVLTFRDVNADNFALYDVWSAMATATSREAFVAAHAETQAVPWVYTMMATAEGEAVFLESSRTAWVADEQLEVWETGLDSDFIARTFADFGVVVLDGGNPDNAWVDDPRAAAPGIVPFEEAPLLVRDDYVFNANDSHWLANVQEPLEGYPRTYGEERRLFLPRTRMNARLLEDTPQWELEQLTDAVLRPRSIIAETLRDDVVARCTAVESVADACAVLATWDGRYGLDSAGAVLWRETLSAFDVDSLIDAGELYAVPFDPDDPVDTPRTLTPAPDEGPDPIVDALADAAARLATLGHPPGITLGELQFQLRGDQRFPMAGGMEWEGTIGIAGWHGPGIDTVHDDPSAEVLNAVSGLRSDGYPVNDGNSWILGLAFGDDGPQASAVMVYSQSEDPSSPFFTDQSALLGRGELRPVLFHEEDIAAAVVETITLVE